MTDPAARDDSGADDASGVTDESAASDGSTAQDDSSAPDRRAASDDSAALVARDVVVERGATRPLDGLSVRVPAGSTTLIRGRSGAGKTTLFEVLGLLDSPDAGSILVDDVDAATLSDRARTRLRRDHIGVIFQEFNLIPDLTAWENARLPLDHADRRDDEWLATLFDRLGVADLRDRAPDSLSGGEKQRVAIARALAARPAVVLADEPTGHLDPETAERVMDLLLESPAFADAALVVVSHDPTVTDRFERVFELVDGELVARDGPVDALETRDDPTS